MKKEDSYYINISARDLVNICVDEKKENSISGRIYHCYTKEPQVFENELQLLKQMENLYDSIGFPRASTKCRYFVEPEKHEIKKPEKVCSQKDIIKYSGKKGTFITYVQYRQNSDWQGEISWQEGRKVFRFNSTLDFIKILVNALKEKK